MCTQNCLRFVNSALERDDIAGKRVLEVGSYDINGSIRPQLESFGPSEYVGVDIEAGPCVDVVCAAEGLEQRFGRASFDVVLTTEMLEHVRDWRTVVSNLKSVLRPGGLLVITTRSPGFPLHGYPYDFWRYEPDDMRAIFADFASVEIEPDSEAEPGVFVRARKHAGAPPDPVDLDMFALHSVLYRRRSHDVSAARFALVRVGWGGWRRVKKIVPIAAKNRLRDYLSKPI
jgi:SAM-dependent methyltransferase